MVEIITDYGYCFGVKQAIEKMKSLKDCKGQIYLMHPLLHNKVENDALMKEINASFYQEGICLRREDALLLSAHGHSLQEEQRFRNRCTLIDATCPLILSRYKMIPPFEKGKTYLYLGKENHQESIGFLSHFPYFSLIDTQKDVIAQLQNFSFEKETVLVPQTTIADKTLQMVKEYVSLKSRLVFSLPICPLYSKRSKQGIESIKLLEDKCNAFLVCGDISSSNAKEIFKSMHEANPNMKGQICLSIEDLDLKEFMGKNIYIASATSVSKERVEKLKKDLEQALGE